MAITTVYSRMQQKRGLLGDFDASKLLAGEIAVTNDTNTSNQRMYFCISPGTVKRLGTYEDFNQAIADYLATYITQLQGYVTEANTSATNAHTSELNAKTSETNAKTSETNSATSATSSQNYYLSSKSYAVGDTGTRVGEDTDNSKYYCEQAKQAVSALTNAFVYMGTITFENIPTTGMQQGYTYNISNSFTTDSRFKEGAGNIYTAGTNISYTSDGYLDVLGGKMNDYLRKDGDSATNTTTFTVASTETDIASGDTHATLFGKILKKFGLIGIVSSLNTYVTTSIVGAINWLHTKVINGISPEYSASSTYRVGQFVFYQGTLYRCIIKVDTPMAWNTSYWTSDTTTSWMYRTCVEYNSITIPANGTVYLFGDMAYRRSGKVLVGSTSSNSEDVDELLINTFSTSTLTQGYLKLLNSSQTITGNATPFLNYYLYNGVLNIQNKQSVTCTIKVRIYNAF